MKQTALRSVARFMQLLTFTALAWIAFAGAIHAQTDAAPTTAAPNSDSTNAQSATPPPTQATDITQIPGADITKTKGVITGFRIVDGRTLTEADYKLIRQTETLKDLNFARGPTDAEIKILAGMPAVETIGVNAAPLTDAGLPVLATFKNLRSAGFLHSGITGTGLAALSTLPNLENLTVAGSLSFGDPGMAAVGQLTHLKGFRTWHSAVTLEGIKSLTSLKELQNLMLGQRLSNKPPPLISDDAIAVLATIPSLQNINVGEARLSLAALSKLSQLPNLKNLTLAGIDIPESDIATLKQQLPKTQIKWTAPDPNTQKRINGIFGPPATAADPNAPPPTP